MYEREIDGAVYDFGVSGDLYNSNLLMYDRQTDSRWAQVSGIAVVGELTGTRMAYYPSQMMSWGEWRETYPDSEVLSRRTGYRREYDAFPYQRYFGSADIWFDVAAHDERLPPKTPVTGIEMDEMTYVAYIDDDVRAHSPVNDEVEGVALLVLADPAAGGAITIFRREVEGRKLTFDASGGSLVDRETGTRWGYDGRAIDGELAGSALEPLRQLSLFWFAWAAFHPGTLLWSPPQSGTEGRFSVSTWLIEYT